MVRREVKDRFRRAKRAVGLASCRAVGANQEHRKLGGGAAVRELQGVRPRHGVFAQEPVVRDAGRHFASRRAGGFGAHEKPPRAGLHHRLPPGLHAASGPFGFGRGGHRDGTGADLRRASPLAAGDGVGVGFFCEHREDAACRLRAGGVDAAAPAGGRGVEALRRLKAAFLLFRRRDADVAGLRFRRGRHHGLRRATVARFRASSEVVRVVRRVRRDGVMALHQVARDVGVHRGALGAAPIHQLHREALGVALARAPVGLGAAGRVELRLAVLPQGFEGRRVTRRLIQVRRRAAIRGHVRPRHAAGAAARIDRFRRSGGLNGGGSGKRQREPKQSLPYHSPASCSFTASARRPGDKLSASRTMTSIAWPAVTLPRTMTASPS